MCSSDGQRMFDAAAVGSLLAGGPLVAALGIAYNLYILGPTSLLGSAIFILFYPTMVSTGPHVFSWKGLGPSCPIWSFRPQMFSSRMTAYFRRRGVAKTDKRVQKMNEILSYIKFIKMYAWVKAFSQDVQSTRSPKYTVTMVMRPLTDRFLSNRSQRGGAQDPGAHRVLPEHHRGRGSGGRGDCQCGDVLCPHAAGIRSDRCSGTAKV